MKELLLIVLLTLNTSLDFLWDQCERIEIAVRNETSYPREVTVGVRCYGCGTVQNPMRGSDHTLTLEGYEQQVLKVEWALYGVELPLTKTYYLEAFVDTFYIRTKAKACIPMPFRTYLPIIQ